MKNAETVIKPETQGPDIEGTRFEHTIKIRLALSGHSPVSRIFRHAVHSDEFPPSQEAFWILLHDAVRNVKMGHPEWLHLDHLHVLTSDGKTTDITVDVSNTQFSGADRQISHFSAGYEPDILTAIDVFVPNDGVFVDAGANWGYFPVHLATRPDFLGTIVAVEPSPPAFGDLAKIIDRLDLRQHVTALPFALGDSLSTLTISDGIFSGNNQTGIGKGSTVVACVPLDQIFTDNKLNRLDLLKIDVEGAEPSVLQGAKQTIKRHRPVMIFEHWLAAGEESFVTLDSVAHKYDLYTVADLAITFPEGREIFSPARITAVLAPVTIEKRALYAERINVLAVPRERDVKKTYADLV